MVSSYLTELEEIGAEVYFYMPVPTGYGKRNSLDYHLCLFGRFIAIETKAEGEWLTPMQRLAARDIVRAGGKVFIISGVDGLDAFKRHVTRQLAADGGPALPADP